MAGLTLGAEGSGYTTPTKYALAAIEERSRALARHRSSIGGQHTKEKSRTRQRDLVQEIAAIKDTLTRPTNRAAVTHYLQCEEAWRTATYAERKTRVDSLLRKLRHARKKV